MLAKAAGRRPGPRLHRAGRRQPRRPGGRRRAARQAPGRRCRQRPQHLDQRPDRSRCPPSARCSAWPTRSTWRRPARCCTCRWTSARNGTSTRRSPAGSPSPGRRSTRSSPWPRVWPRAPTPSPARSAPTAPTRPPAPPRRSPAIPAVRARVAAVDRRRRPPTEPYPERRRAAQRDRLRLPPLPTTTIGSFPQTSGTAQARAVLRPGRSTGGLREAHAGRDPRGDRLPGKSRARRAGARRARTQRHGAVLRRAAHRLPGHRSTAGCSPTAPATSARRSSPATSPGPSR